MICKAFDEYAEKHKIENNTDTSEEDAMGSGTETQMNSGSESQTQAPQTEAPTEDETVTDEADSTDESVSNDDETTEDNSDDEYIIPDSDSKKLTKADLKGFSKKELRYARNEIYARHGRIFNDDELQAYFEGKSWYVGTQIAEEFDESELSKVEKANVRLIQKYENK